MIIWSKWGILVFVIVIVMMILSDVISGIVFNDPDYYRKNRWVLSMSLLISGIFCFGLGKMINKTKEKTYIDKETQEEVKMTNPKSTLFFIPIEYWGPILWVLSLVQMFWPKK